MPSDHDDLRDAFPASPQMFDTLSPETVQPSHATPPPAVATSEADALRAAFPASPGLWNRSQPQPQVDPAVVSAFPNSPEMTGAAPQRNESAVRDQIARWAHEARADAEIGGERFDENVRLARGVLDRFGDPELRDQLNQTGWGNHRSVIRLLARLSAALK
jgi:hypothetical protein